jgi:DNA-binding response OmpR family regulator
MFFRSSPSPASPQPESIPAAVSPPSPNAATGGSRGLVLVVDDSNMIRGAVVKTLKAAGYEILQAENGRIGVSTWEQNASAINLVLSDVFMPEMDGMTMARELRRRSRTLPIVLMSSKLDEDSRWVAEEAGFRLLPKPFKDAYLLELIARMLRLQASR